MTPHAHTTYVEGCFRCELSRDEAASALAEETPTYSDRGFAAWGPIEGTHRGDSGVEVYESSAADGPHLWVGVRGECHLDTPPEPFPGITAGIADGSAHVHLSMESARRLRDMLDAAITHSEERFA